MKKTGITWIPHESQCVHSETARICVAWSLPAASTYGAAASQWPTTTHRIAAARRKST
jgi:hypothetical protein